MTATPPLAPCPRCGATNAQRLPNDPGEEGDFDQCNVCSYIYEDHWQSYPWLKTQPGETRCGE